MIRSFGIATAAIAVCCSAVLPVNGATKPAPKVASQSTSMKWQKINSYIKDTSYWAKQESGRKGPWTSPIRYDGDTYFQFKVPKNCTDVRAKVQITPGSAPGDQAGGIFLDNDRGNHVMLSFPPNSSTVRLSKVRRHLIRLNLIPGPEYDPSMDTRLFPSVVVNFSGYCR